VAVVSDLIYDVGMNTGQDTAFYLAKGFRVVAVAADKTLCDAASTRFAADVSSGQLVVVSAAVASRPGPLTFYRNPMSQGGTIYEEWAERNAKLGSPPSAKVEVDGILFQSLIAKYGVPHYLKADVEGADLLCLEGLLGAPDVPDFVSIESSKRRWSELRREFELLSKLGYRRFKIVDQDRGVPHQVAPQPAREGKYVPVQFEEGASGLFGDETPGEWLTRRQAMRQYLPIFFRYRTYGDFGVLRPRPGVGRLPAAVLSKAFGTVSWYDTHATR
jgi:FkbM family methyltransferase